MIRIIRKIGPWLALVCIWAGVTETRIVDPLFLSSPTDTARALFDGVLSGSLLRALVATLGRAFGGFVLATVIGVPVGLMLGGLPKVKDAIGGIVDALRSMPATALFPAFLLLFGIGNTAKVADSDDGDG
jgi:NitT/TauT family transport system permease protein